MASFNLKMKQLVFVEATCLETSSVKNGDTSQYSLNCGHLGQTQIIIMGNLYMIIEDEIIL